ncbi:MAG: TNT domain-containing protein [Alphaproteobacteria bacterium]|nr:TNT domain-containing protein [Alphaproteobacteria bacterium]
MSNPDNDGCTETPVTVTLRRGEILDRFSLSDQPKRDGGRYFSTPEYNFHSRSLPYDCNSMIYYTYTVQEPVTLQSCNTAAYYDEPGGAIQYMTSNEETTIADLIRDRYVSVNVNQYSFDNPCSR